MNSRIILGLAGLSLVGAVFAGYWGLTLTQQPAPALVAQLSDTPPTSPLQSPAQQTEDTTRKPVVVLQRDVAPFAQITADDVALEKLRTVPAGSLTSLDQAIGRTPWRALKAGSWLNDESFDAGGSLARMIRPDERALAVAVDEVVNAGGQLAPGDYVDVLLFLRMDTTNPQASSQLVIPALRVLGVGEQMGLTNDGQPANPAHGNDDKLRQEQQRASARTVLLAVPEPLISRLMLAAQAGVLRLAVRSAEENRLARYWAGESDSAANLANADRELIQFNELAMTPPPKNVMAIGASTPARKAAVEVIRGNETTQKTP
ncbi:Flp pilus assembly protein CpaB [Pseudomonas sp. REP124]|uniref:Flp pilus assembly protein CpaB n=1 Tax=Pseudomonas sp. REP124 TaxID=2875731 RepID=UPI001CCF3AA1|nr:Flp pilus assembly protein CpaB [Pseudomonas sp. REP124]MBZ9782626.1 Flp pilus assembly protein CpaB [Pseudomonas sp. REP124]